MALIVDRIKHLTQVQKAIAALLATLILLGLFVWFVFIPNNDEISQLEETIAGLQNDINIRRVMVRHLEELKVENRLLEERLALLQKKFPSEAEVEVFLKQVSDLGEKAGLNFKLWKPSERRVHPSRLYLEVPVAVEVSGEYHALGIFFDQISHLPRIVNWSDIKMGNAKLDKNRVMIETSFLATAFATVPAGAEPAAAEEKKGKPKKPAFEGTL